jgi:deazaflavin-dependent oxidoreductase (nitroreductase family)
MAAPISTRPTRWPPAWAPGPVAHRSGLVRNLVAAGEARVEVEGRTLRVRARHLSPTEAEAFWPRLLRQAPDYARYQQRTDRVIPLLRLTSVDTQCDPPSGRC